MGDGTVHLHCTDVDGEWLIARRDGEITRDRASTPRATSPPAGTASDLLLFLWGRVPADQLEVFGDADLLGAVPRRRSRSEPASAARGRGSCRAPRRPSPGSTARWW